MASSSHSTFHFVLVNSLHRIITNVSLQKSLTSMFLLIVYFPCLTPLCVCVCVLVRVFSLFQSHLDWWPKIDAVYCYSGELRFMFADTLNRVIQGAGTHAPLRMTPVRALPCVFNCIKSNFIYFVLSCILYLSYILLI